MIEITSLIQIFTDFCEKIKSNAQDGSLALKVVDTQGTVQVADNLGKIIGACDAMLLILDSED